MSHCSAIDRASEGKQKNELFKEEVNAPIVELVIRVLRQRILAERKERQDAIFIQAERTNIEFERIRSQMHGGVMKKILIYGLLLLIAIYGVGYYNLNESGVTRLLDKVQSFTMEGDAQGVCDLLADDMSVAIVDHTVEIDRRLGNGKLNGGKSDLCNYTKQSIAKVPASSRKGLSVQTQRNGMQIKKNWLHPWTIEATYNEKQTLTLQAGGRSMVIKTENDDKVQLVMTFAGVKVKRLESEAWLQ